MMAEVKLLKVVFIFLLGVEGVFSFCKKAPTLCSDCSTTVARCQHDNALIIPQSLETSMTEIDILQNGESETEITADLFSRYRELVDVSIAGPNIVSVENGAYSILRKLTHLRIHRTSIAKIPDEMLPVNSSIVQLNLAYNKLTSIPYQLFKNLPLLKNLNLEFNFIVIPDCTSIGEEFVKLPRLTSLRISGTRCATNANSTFFQPISNIRILNLTSTNIARGSPYIFKNLRFLENLDISRAEDLRRCPSNATELFTQLPDSLEVLTLRRWRTTRILDQNCWVNDETFKGLKELPQLSQIDMKTSDLIFGNNLNRSVFSGFQQLKRLNLAWCRFSFVEDFVFDDCPKLEWVSFKGNPLGSRKYTLTGNGTDSGEVKKSKISVVKLSETLIYSDYATSYNYSEILLGTSLTSIDIRDNFLDKMPIFFLGGDNNYVYPLVQEIRIGGNLLTNLKVNLDTHKFTHCEHFPNLTKFSAESNQLEIVEDLCESLTSLNLADNGLTKYWDTNQYIISQLIHLEKLDLSHNNIRYLLKDFFARMVNLKELRIQSNNFSDVDINFVANNYFLEIIDMRDNYLRYINVDSIKHLVQLRELLLDYNSISALDKNLTDYLQRSKSIKTFSIIGNSLQCSCTQDFVQNFIKRANIVPNAARISCHGPKELRGKLVYNYRRNDLECDHIPNIKIAFTVLGSILAAVLVVVPCYKYRWYITHAKVVISAVHSQISRFRFERKCSYDAYVMYNSASDDLDFVVNHLRPAIEEVTTSKEKALKLYIHDRDALPGSLVHTEMLSAMENSRKIILVLSNSYLTSAECQGQADLAGRETYGLKFYQPNRIMVLVREELSEDAIRSPFTSLLTENVIDMYDVNEKAVKRIWQRIGKFISKPRYEYRRKGKYEAEDHSTQLTEC